MKALILAAGMASRLRPLTDMRPKCLLQVGSRCLLQRTVDNLLDNGISRIAVVTGYRAEMIRDFLTATYPQTDFTFIHNADYTTTNNIYSLWLAKAFAAADDFMLLDSDILFDGRIIARLLANKGATLALNSHELGEEEIKVITGDDGLIAEISKTCCIADAIGESVGIEKITAAYSQALFDELDDMIVNEKMSDVFYEKAFERLIPKGHKFSVTDTTDLFSIELDTVEDFNQAKRLIPEELY